MVYVIEVMLTAADCLLEGSGWNMLGGGGIFALEPPITPLCPGNLEKNFVTLIYNAGLPLH